MSSLNLMAMAATVIAAIGLAVLISAFVLSQKARSAAYYGLRQDARKAAVRRFAVALFALSASGAVFGLQFLTPDLTWTSLGLPTSIDELLPGGVAVSTTTPEASAAETPVVAPTAAQLTTRSVLATVTRAPTVQPATPANLGAGPRLTLHSVATGVDVDGKPVDEGSRFSARTKTVYVFFNYRDVPPSATIRHTWFHNGGSVFFENSAFAGRNGEGVSMLRWTPAGGFEPGLYEVRIVLGNVPQFVANFEVR